MPKNGEIKRYWYPASAAGYHPDANQEELVEQILDEIRFADGDARASAEVTEEIAGILQNGSPVSDDTIALEMIVRGWISIGGHQVKWPAPPAI